MHLQSILTLLALTLSTSGTAIPGPITEEIAEPAAPLEARGAQISWNAKKGGNECSKTWKGVCYEHCVTEGTGSSKNCQRNTIQSAIDGSGCGWLNSKCKCVCNKK